MHNKEKLYVFVKENDFTWYIHFVFAQIQKYWNSVNSFEK
jgi:hypothetical protein